MAMDRNSLNRYIALGVALAWGLWLFDLLLGSVATFTPDLYLSIVHPHLEEPQRELIRRTGVLWLGFSFVAIYTATCSPARRARWFLVLGLLRLMEVPADLVYGMAAAGADTLGQVLILSAPPLNLGLGGYLFWLSRRMHHAARLGHAPVEDR